jgi:hypothetical protein
MKSQEGGDLKMFRRISTLTLIAVAIGAFAVTALGQGKLKECRVSSRPLTLQKNQKTLRLTGVVFGQSTKEFLIKPTSGMTVDIRLPTDSPLRFDVYLLDPPTVMGKRAVEWSGTFESGREYTLAVSNCSGKATATYRLEVTPR